MKRAILIYIAVLILSGLTMFVAFERGHRLQTRSITPDAPALAAGTVPAAPGGNIIGSLGRLLAQVLVIVLATRLMGILFTRCGQPAVVGEVLAGILLGPSLLGWLWPAANSVLFAPDSLGLLRTLSQVGVCLFMFVIGLDLDLSRLRQKAYTAVVVSHASITIPCALGIVAAVILYPGFAAPGTSFTAFALFMGIAMSITAFPVLARILNDRGMARTVLGTMALTCAAVNDASAWAALAFVVAIARATGMASTTLSLVLVVVFVALMLLVVRPLAARWSSAGNRTTNILSAKTVAIILVLLVASALATELMGIHALFGAFLAGVVTPQRKEFHAGVGMRLENFSSRYLLPLFFAFSGLRTEVGLLNNPADWLACAAIIGIATAGKLGGTTLTARLMGMNWNDSFALGALMNTRGLVELVALNIGYDLGILPPRIFAMMVLMALVTTFLTGPLLNLTERAKRAATF